MLTNLLLMANVSLASFTDSVGVYVGDGLPPVPAKLAAKIRRGEFVEKGELLPEFWSMPKVDDGEARRDGKSRRTRKVTDIFTWLHCFGSYVSVLGLQAPKRIPELMVYMTTTVRVSQGYSGLAWVRYDAAFRRQAALTGNSRWSVINSTWYTICIMGAAKSTTRCELWSATTHMEKECAQQGDPDPGMHDRMKAIETAVLAISSKPPPVLKPASQARPSGEPCRLWNRNNCSYPRCRHSHVCSGCGGNHPVTRCFTHSQSQRQDVGPGTSAGPGKHLTGARPY